MTERQLSRAVVELAELCGWRCFTISHTRAAGLRSHTGEGWPDLFLVRESQALAVELKSAKGVLRPGQKEWLCALADVPGITTFIFRPKDWKSGYIEQVLR